MTSQTPFRHDLFWAVTRIGPRSQYLAEHMPGSPTPVLALTISLPLSRHTRHLHRVLRLPQRRHDIHSVALARELLHGRVVEAHEHIVLLPKSISTIPQNKGQFSKRDRTFSSPIVNFPCVCLLLVANDSSFLIGSLWFTLMPNLTLPLVYSWPGWNMSASESPARPRSVGIHDLRRPWYHPASSPASGSAPCPSPLLCLRRNVHSLRDCISPQHSLHPLRHGAVGSLWTDTYRQ
jgi:hypothetical protein